MKLSRKRGLYGDRSLLRNCPPEANAAGRSRGDITTTLPVTLTGEIPSDWELRRLPGQPTIKVASIRQPIAGRTRCGTDPFRADTDGDGVSDLLDDYRLDPTRSQEPAPNPADTSPRSGVVYSGSRRQRANVARGRHRLDQVPGRERAELNWSEAERR